MAAISYDLDAASSASKRRLRNMRLVYVLTPCVVLAVAAGLNAVIGRDAGAGGFAPRTPATRCHATAYSPRQALPPISVVEVRRMTCRQGARVMRRLAPALSENYPDRLGKTRNRLVSGYRCSGYLIGDASWRITCHRQGRSVTGLTAE